MINSIIDTFREQARQHKAIKAFYYNRNYELGSGNETHPLLWLEDPILGRNQSNLFVNTVNFSVLLIPDSDKEIAELQSIAFSIGLNILERIKKDQSSDIRILPTWTYMSLRNYYDNDACGCRFTIEFNRLNMQNLCLIEEQFDTSKTFADSSDLLPRFELSSGNCELFDGKLPVFDLKTSK